jgi:hypothetical protein
MVVCGRVQLFLDMQRHPCPTGLNGAEARRSLAGHLRDGLISEWALDREFGHYWPMRAGI